MIRLGLDSRSVKRIVKCTLASLICYIYVLITPVNDVMGPSSYVIVMVAVNMHPGRRFGAMIEAVVLGLIGTAIGLAYGIFGHFLADEVLRSYGLQNALAFLAIMEVIMLFIHGFVRSYSPRLFLLVFMTFLVVHFSFLSNLGIGYGALAKDYAVPICVGTGTCLVINLVLFPEFGSSNLGGRVVESITNLRGYFKDTVEFFVRENEQTLEELVDYKVNVRQQLEGCKSVMTESLFEISYSYMSPLELKPTLKKLAHSAVAFNAMIGACELEFALLGDLKDQSRTLQREIEFADKHVLLQFLEGVKQPIKTLSERIGESLEAIEKSISYGYDVDCNKESMPDKETLNKLVQSMAQGLVHYDYEIANRLENVRLQDDVNTEMENMLLPRDEFFLISSFLMNLREMGNVCIQMLTDCDEILSSRKRREAKGFFGRGLWFSGLSSKKLFYKYLTTGNAEEKDADIASLRSHLDQGDPKTKKKADIRTIVADIIEFPSRFKPHLQFAFNFTLLLMLVSFPAFSPNLRQWYTDIRGAWVGFTAAIALESSIGATTQIFVTRTIGLTIGSAWGYATYVAGSWGGNSYVMAVMMAIALVPGFYVLLNSSYPKAGVVYMVSAQIVVLSTVRPSVPGTILENFLKRCLSMLVGGSAALAVQITFFPLKAREQLVKKIITAIHCCGRIEDYVAQGVTASSTKLSEGLPIYTPLEADECITKQFKRAKAALQAADTFRESSKREFRLKGPFEPYEQVYREIIFVLHQILDKFQNVSFLRKHYGSAVLEDLGPYVFLYRRELYGCLSLTLRAVELALQTKSKLPQYMPSARVAHLRVINRVREVLAYETGNNSRAASRRSSFVGAAPDQQQHQNEGLSTTTSTTTGAQQPVFNLYDDEPTLFNKNSMTRKKFMSWSATSAGLEEIVAYVEELVYLTKMVVGVNQFRFGFLSKPIMDSSGDTENDNDNDDSDENDEFDEDALAMSDMPKRMIRRTFTIVGDRPQITQPLESGVSSGVATTNQPPTNALQRVVSRKRN